MIKRVIKYLYVVFLLCISCGILAQENNFTVSGTIRELDSKSIRISYIESDGGTKRASIPVLNGSFSYSAPINKTTMISINPGVERVLKRTQKGYFPATSSLLQFIASPGAHITFSGKVTDFVDAYPSGDASNRDLAKLNKSVFPLMNEVLNLKVKIANKIITDSIAINSIKKFNKEINERVVLMKTNFITENLTSVAAVWLLSDMMLRIQIPDETAEMLFMKMDKQKLAKVPFYKEVAKRIDGISSTAIGKPVPGIKTTNTFDGKEFDINSLKGKYVIIDFWGTWCGPCVSGMPKMKEYLTKYKDKLEIVGIAQESEDGERWKNFLIQNPAYQWHQILNKKDESDFILKFNVAGFPTKIIIDPKGTILGRFVGENDEIYNELDKLLE